MSNRQVFETAASAVEQWLEGKEHLRRVPARAAEGGLAWDIDLQGEFAPVSSVRLVLPAEFPLEPCRFEVDAQLELKLPHVERGGKLCLGLWASPSDLEAPIAAVLRAMETLQDDFLAKLQQPDWAWRLFTALSPAHRSALEPHNSTYAAEPYVMLTVDEANQTAARYWKPTGLRPNTIFTTSSVEAVRSMVADGMGVTILSDMVYRPWSLEGQRIELRNVVADIPTMDVGLAWNHTRGQSPAARTFHEFMSLSFGGAGSSV